MATFFPEMALENWSQMNTVRVLVATPFAITEPGDATNVEADPLMGPATYVTEAVEGEITRLLSVTSVAV